MAFCDQCGTQLSSNAKFCPECGQPLKPEPNAAPPEIRPSPSGPTSAPLEAVEGNAAVSATSATPSPVSLWQPPSASSPQPNQRKWLLLGGAVIGVLVVLCVGVSVLVVVANRAKNFGSPTQVANSGQSGTISFGDDYRTTNGNLTIINPRTSFTAGDTLAYVAYTKEAANTTSLELLVTYIVPGGSEQVVNYVTVYVPDPKDNQFANRYSAQVLIGNSPGGTYKLKLLREKIVLAEGTFSYYH